MGTFGIRIHFRVIIKKTAQTNPLQIANVQCVRSNGRQGICVHIWSSHFLSDSSTVGIHRSGPRRWLPTCARCRGKVGRYLCRDVFVFSFFFSRAFLTYRGGRRVSRLDLYLLDLYLLDGFGLLLILCGLSGGQEKPVKKDTGDGSVC